MIPISDPKRQFATLQDEILPKFKDVLLNGQYILGPNVTTLENKLAKKLEVCEAITVANGTDALTLTLHAYGIGNGDEVITTPFTFFSTAESITRVGAKPVFVDVDKQTYNLNPSKIKEKITSATKAILPVHLFGQPAKMDEIMQIANEHNLIVIEDACQAFGAEYKNKKIGSIGNATCFSFFPTKNLSTPGDGGVITTSDHQLANRLRSLRTHGSSKKYFHHEIGYNSRLDEIHAVILLICLEHIDVWNEKRIMLANRYNRYLKRIGAIQLPKQLDDVKHVYHLYCLKSKQRKKWIDHLTKHNIQTGIYYPRCIHLQEAYQYLGYQQGDFPIAESLAKELFAIPLFPHLSIKEQDYVMDVLMEAEVKRL